MLSFWRSGIAVFATACVFHPCPCLAHIRQSLLRTLVEDSIEGGVVQITPPDIRPDADGFLAIYMGGVESSEFSRDRLLNRIVAAQFRVSMCRSYLNRQGWQQLWKSYLAIMEDGIQQMLDELASDHTDAQKTKRISYLARKMDESWHEGFREMATAQKLRERRYLQKTNKLHTITLKPQPDGEIGYMPEIRYKLYLLLKENGANVAHDAGWTTPASRRVQIAGSYWFYVKYKDGTAPMRAKRNITKDEVLLLKPDGIEAID